MLVVSRKKWQKIFIGTAGDVITEPIKIQVTRIGSDTVRMGVDCPPHITADREEIYKAKLQSGFFNPEAVPIQTTSCLALMEEIAELKAAIAEREREVSYLNMAMGVK